MALAQVINTESVAAVLKSLSFPVAKEDAFTKDGQRIPGKVIVRTDTRKPLSWVGDTYGLIPHSTMLEPVLKEFADQFVIKRTVIEREGRRVEVDLLSKEQFSVIKGDAVRLKISMLNSLDRTQSFKYLAGAFRLKCSNGMGVFLEGASVRLTEAHTKLVEQRVNAGRLQEGISLLLKKFSEATANFKRLADTKVTDEQAQKLVESVVGKKSVEEVLKLWTEGRGQNGDKTAWALYNGVSQLLTDKEQVALLPVSASVRTFSKTTAMLRGLNLLASKN